MWHKIKLTWDKIKTALAWIGFVVIGIGAAVLRAKLGGGSKRGGAKDGARRVRDALGDADERDRERAERSRESAELTKRVQDINSRLDERDRDERQTIEQARRATESSRDFLQRIRKGTTEGDDT